MHWIITGVKPTYYLKLCWCPKISLSKVWVQLRDQFYILNKEICMALFHTDQNFFCIYITLCIILYITLACGSQVHGSYAHMSQWHLHCSVGQQMWPTFNSGSDTENFWGYQDNFIYKSNLLLYIEAFWIIMVHYRL